MEEVSEERKTLLRAAKKYREGWALRIDVANEETYREVTRIVRIVMRERA